MLNEKQVIEMASGGITYTHQNTYYQRIVLIIASLMYTISLASASKPSVKATVPVNPVDTGGILSVNCKVRNSDLDSHTLHIYRRTSTSGKSEQLSVDGDVLQKVDDRVFLAFRQLEDQSVIYFLSIMEVTKDDQGLYSCKLITKEGSIREVANDTANISVTYFPPETDPVCSSLQSNRVLEGTVVNLSCSSEIANPTVSIAWTTTSGAKFGSKPRVVNNRIHTSLTITLSRRDNDVVFLCDITSNAFPDMKRQCHIGPVTVTPNPDILYTDRLPDTSSVVKPTKTTLDVPDENIVKSDPTFSAKKCNKICSYFSYPLLHWIVATASALLLAVVLLICIVFVYGKYRRVKRQTKEELYRNDGVRPRLPDGIYSELECKQGESKMYMALVDSNPASRSSHQADIRNKTMGGYYGAMPVTAPPQF